MMILHETGTGKKFYEMSPMEVCPRSALIANKEGRAWHQYYGERPPHCPAILELEPEKTVRYHLGFLGERTG